jgi:hypothetical protein
LAAYYNLNFALLYHHKISVDEFENMIPWEKDLYVGMITKKVEEENEKIKLKQSANRAARKRGRS